MGQNRRIQSPQADVRSLFWEGFSWFWRNLEWNGNAQNRGHDGEGPNSWKERGGTGWVSREGVTFVILISCLPSSGFLLSSQTFLKTDRNKLFTEKCGLLKGGMAQRRNCSYLPTLCVMDYCLPQYPTCFS